MDILKALFGTPQYVSRADTKPGDPDPDPNDVWIFTDPDARDEYARRGEIDHLVQDIAYEVMRGGAWQPEELAYKREIRRLLQDGLIADKGTYWFRSPHPTVYRAQRNGILKIAGKEYHFRAGDDLVFQCRMERDEREEDPGPLLIARLKPSTKAILCADMGSAMKGMNKMR